MISKILNGNNKKKFFSFFLELISLGSPRAIVIDILIIFTVLLLLPTEGLFILPYRCVFKTIILPIIFRGNCPTEGIFAGCECPGCGLTRAMSRLLHGDIDGALDFNILVIPVFIVMISLLVYNLWRWRKG